MASKLYLLFFLRMCSMKVRNDSLHNRLRITEFVCTFFSSVHEVISESEILNISYAYVVTDGSHANYKANGFYRKCSEIW